MSERQPIADAAMDALFREARTYSAWQDRPVTDQALRDLYDLLKWAPTSANAAPARFAFLRSTEAKARLRPALAPLNVEKTMAGKPCFGCDQEFFPEGHVKTNFLCNLGYADSGKLYPRLLRLPFSEACSLL
jgi:hypothetical protein